MRKNFKDGLIDMSLLLACFLFSAASSTAWAKYEMSSQWKNRDVKIDGASSDWENVMGDIEGQNLSIGMMNDSTDIYLCLIIGDQAQQRHILRRGITLWLDGSGGKEKNFGIRFPVGKRPNGMPMREQDTQQKPSEKAGQQMEQELLAAQTELEIRGAKDEDTKKMPLSDAEGIVLKMGIQASLLVYEVRIPIAMIGEIKKNKIGLGLETEKMEQGGMRPEFAERSEGGVSGRGRPSGGPPSGGPPMGGGPGGMGGGPGGMGGPPSGDMPQMPKAIKLWITTDLASAAQ
jgi:hypothetical protein